MPLYTDGNFYYSGGSSQLYSPYYPSGLYGASAALPSSSGYSPYSSTYNRAISGTYVVPLTPPRSPSSYTNTHSLTPRYQPKLTTITETSPLISSARHGLSPLTRIQSPKYTSFSSTTSSGSSYTAPKYIPPRPIHINTADIDVSSSRYRKRKETSTEDEPKKKTEPTKTPSQSPSPSGSVKKRGSREKEKSKSETDGTADESRAKRSTISRNRPVVRLSTIRTKSKDRGGTANVPVEPTDKIFRDLPHPEIATATAENLTWRQKLAEDLAAMPTYPLKKSPGDLIRERYLIQDNNNEDTVKKSKKSSAASPMEVTPTPQVIDEVVVELDPLHHTIRRLSLPRCPTFHDICEDISSDKIDDDLNAGELRRRASLIQEQEQEILNQLQKSASGTFQLIHLERRGSQDSQPDETHAVGNKRKSRKSKKIRHKITAIVDVENPTVAAGMPILVEKEEDAVTPTTRESKPSPKFTFNVESVEEHAEVNQIFKLPKKKSIRKASKPKAVALPEGFVAAPPKVKSNGAPKKTAEKQKTFVSTAEIFTFSQQSIEASKSEELPPDESNLLEVSKLKQSIPEKHTIETKQPLESTKIELSNIKVTKPENAVLSNIKVEDKKIKTPSPTTPKKLLKTKETMEVKPALKAATSFDVETKKPMRAISSTLEKSQSLQTEPAIKLTTIESPVAQTPKQATSTTTLQTSMSLDAGGPTAKSNQAKQLGKTQSLNTEDIQPGFATPKPIRKSKPKIETDDDEDFWSQIGTRETIYMANRKKSLHEIQWQRVEEVEPAAEGILIEIEPSTQPIQETKQAFVAPQKASTILEPTNKQTTSPASTIKEPKPPTTMQNESAVKLTSNVAKLTETSKAIETKPTATTTAGKATIPTTTTTIAATTATPKINAGQTAKSPEQQTKSKAVSNELTAHAKQDKTPINNTATSAKTTDTATVAKTTTTTTPTSTTTITEPETASKSTPKDAVVPTVEKHLQPEVTTRVNKVTEDAAATQKKRTSDPKSPQAATKSTSDSKKTKLPLGKPKAVAKVSPPTTASTPINADHFVTKAPPPATTNQTKNAAAAAAATSPTTTTTTTAALKKTDKKSSSPAKKVEKPKESTTKPAVAENVLTKTTTSAADTAPATTTTTIATATAKIADEHATTACGTSESSSNLAKFATVTDLAQCLQDVDADLDDYIPSSAEEFDDDTSLSDISLPDGCEHLSEKMKKKLKLKKKKERQAEKARFDPQKKVKIDLTNKCYVKDEAPRYPLVATPRPLWRREKIEYPDDDTESESESDSGSTEETTEDSEECTTSEEYEDDLAATTSAGAGAGATKDNSSIIRMSTCSNDSGFEGGTAPSSPKKMLECDVNCHKKCERLTANLCGVNQKLIVEALANVKRGARETRESPSTPPSLNPAYKIDANVEEEDETSCTYTEFQKSGRFTAPATVIPRFKNYCVDDFHFLAVLGKGSFGKVLLAELRDTTYYYAVKCLKKDVVLEDDDVDSTLIERKVLALGTKHPYLCHLFCTFQTESHLFFVMEYLNGGDLMFHIQESGRFPEERARFYGAEIISGLKFLHKKGIIYRDLKLDNVLLDYEGHVRIADFGMCKLQIYLDKTADSFCGTPDYMAPEIVKGEKYNQNVDWWSFGVLLYEMLIGQSPFSGCDEDELFWSICNEIPWFPVYITAEAMSILKGLLEKDYTKRIGSQYSPAGDVSDHIFFRPIDWNLLEKRQLEPPFRPQVKHPLDTQYFDRVFTKERVRLTPIDKDILQSMDQKQFLGFTYTNPHITLD